MIKAITPTPDSRLMNTQIGFLTKVILLSAAISLLIKFAGPFFPITGTNLTALTFVLLPSVVLGVIFSWRWYIAD